MVIHLLCMELGYTLTIIGHLQDNYVLKRKQNSRHKSEKRPLTND